MTPPTTLTPETIDFVKADLRAKQEQEAADRAAAEAASAAAPVAQEG